MDLAGKVALVTGAGRKGRLGHAIAMGLAEAGCDIAVHFHGAQSDAAATAEQITTLGRRAWILNADLRDATAARSLGNAAARALGGLHILVNSAGIMVRQTIEEITPESWDETLDLNLRAYFFVAQGALPQLRKVKGKIVNLADVAGFEPWPAYLPHCVSKAGVVMLTQALARAAAPDVAVNAIAPGAVLLPDDWDQAARDHFAATTPLKRLGDPADVVHAVKFLLENDYMTGTTIPVDGGRLIR